MSDPRFTDKSQGATWTPRAYRNLKIAVLVMGILLVVGFLVVFITIVSRMASTGAPPAGAPAVTALGPDIARLLGPDSEVVSMSVDSNRLALVLRRPEGLSVIVMDLRSGEIVNVLSGSDGG